MLKFLSERDEGVVYSTTSTGDQDIQCVMHGSMILIKVINKTTSSMFEHIMHGNIVPVRRFLDILQSEKRVEEIRRRQRNWFYLSYIKVENFPWLTLRINFRDTQP